MVGLEYDSDISRTWEKSESNSVKMDSAEENAAVSLQSAEVLLSELL